MLARCWYQYSAGLWRCAGPGLGGRRRSSCHLAGTRPHLQGCPPCVPRLPELASWTQLALAVELGRGVQLQLPPAAQGNFLAVALQPSLGHRVPVPLTIKVPPHNRTGSYGRKRGSVDWVQIDRPISDQCRCERSVLSEAPFHRRVPPVGILVEPGGARTCRSAQVLQAGYRSSACAVTATSPPTTWPHNCEHTPSRG